MTVRLDVSISIEDRLALPLGVIGAGRLGAALTGALVAHGYRDVALAGRDAARLDAVATALDVPTSPITSLVERSALVFLAVPDGTIEVLGDTLTWHAGQGVVHSSGARGLDALRGAVARGAHTGCLHPLQTFPTTAVPGRAACAALFDGVTCGVEAAAPLDGLLAAIVGDLGARTVRLEGVDRALYHAAAVLVSNDVVALMAAATRVWASAGLDIAGAQAALAPLLIAAATNAARSPLVEALTGPIARGDASTVERHLRALANEPGLRDVYRSLARELLLLDLGHAPAVREALAALLRGDARASS